MKDFSHIWQGSIPSGTPIGNMVGAALEPQGIRKSPFSVHLLQAQQDAEGGPLLNGRGLLEKLLTPSSVKDLSVSYSSIKLAQP